MNTYLPYVGFVQFPRNPRDLTDRVCPACLVDRAGSSCATCGLDLASPFIAQLDASSMDAAAALDHRLELIGRIRHETAAVQASAQVPGPVPAQVPVPTQVSVPVSVPVPVSEQLGTTVANVVAVTPAVERPAASTNSGVTPVAAPATAATAATAEPRRHLGVQVILLIVGVSLLSIGAVFFLVYAFITFGLVWRSVIIAAVTIGAIWGASLLRKRRLRVTAEGIAVLGIVFVYLDIYAIKANDFFGADSVNDQLYWGIGLLVSTIGFITWNRLSGLRVPSVVASIVVAPSVALIVAGALDAAEDSMRVFWSVMALALGGLAHPLARHRIEKTIVASSGVVGLGLAGIVSPFLVGGDWAPALGFGGVVTVSLAQVWLIARFRYPMVPGRIAAVIGAAAAAFATLVVAIRTEDPGFIAFWPVVIVAIVALGLEVIARRLGSGLPAQLARIAGITATAIGITILLIPVTLAAMPSVALVGAAVPRWSTTGASVISLQPENAAAILALLVVVIMVGAVWAWAGLLDERLVVIGAAALATLVLCVPLVGVLWAAVALWLFISAALLVTLGVARTRGWGLGKRIVLATGSLAASALAYFSSWASLDTWWYGSVVVIALLVAWRGATTRTALRASTLGLAVILSLVAIGAAAFHTNEQFVGGANPLLESSLAVALLAALVLGGSALLASRLSSAETRVVFWLSATTAIVLGALFWIMGTFTIAPNGLFFPYRATTAVIALLLLVALGLWTSPTSIVKFRAERITVCVLLAPAAAWFLDSLARAIPLPSFAVAVAPITAALLVGALALASELLTARQFVNRRVTLETGVAIVGLVSIISVFTAAQSTSTWLILEVAAVTTLIAAISRDGLVSSSYRRKYLGWLALALSVSGLWWALGDSGIDTIELFVLPLAGSLLVIALMVWRGARRTPSESTAAPFIALAALLIAILPVAIVATTGPTLRTISIVTACAVVLIAVSIVAQKTVRRAPLRPYLDVAALASAIGLLVAGFGKAFMIAIEPRRGDIELDIWVAATFAVVVTTVVLQARIRGGDSRGEMQRWRLEVSQIVLLMAIPAMVLIELAVLQATPIGTARAIVLLLILAALHISGQLFDPAPFGHLVGWVALGAAAVTSVIASGIGAIDPIEWATAILATALLVVGIQRMKTDAHRGSWRSLAPGILVLVLPSLTATFTDAPIWRLVGLGVLCVAMILLGALAKLQAPLVIGAVAVLIHAIRTFAPQIVAVYQLTEWWVWAVIGGGIILFVAITLEKRVRDLKSLGTRVTALR